VGDWRIAFKVLVGGKNYLENLGVDWMVILKLISGSEMGQPGMD